jgi:uncharacterized protein
MKIYIFRCRARTRMYAATRYETGSNLPTNSGSWEFCERVELPKDGMVRFAVDKSTVEREVRRNGSYVWDESPRQVGQRTAEIKPVPHVQDHYRPPLEPETVTSEMKIAASVAAKPATVPQVQATAPEAEIARTTATLPSRHQIVWFDIPVRDIDRAMRFYAAVLGIELKREQAGPGMAMAMLPHADGFVGGCLLQNADAKPSESGPLLYLNTNGRLEEAVYAVERHGGKVLSPTHSIAPFGFRAIVLDSEGNRVALHSK